MQQQVSNFAKPKFAIGDKVQWMEHKARILEVRWDKQHHEFQYLAVCGYIKVWLSEGSLLNE